MTSPYFPRSLRFTRLGTYFVLLTIGIGLSAMNTGNNLVYMIFGMMLGFITASGVISEISLRRLDLDWILPGEAHAGESATLRLILKNGKAKLPSFGLEAKVTLTGCNGSQESLPASFLLIPPAAQKSADIVVVPSRRGKYLISGIEVSTRFPFGFFKKSWSRTQDLELLVYPQIARKIRAANISPSRRERDFPVPLKGLGDSFLEVRHFFEGDNPSRISWKISARQARLMVRETERETDKKVILSLDPVEEWKDLNEADLEAAVSFAASFAYKNFREGFAVGISAGAFFLKASQSRKGLTRILEFLALFDPADSSGARFAKIPLRGIFLSPFRASCARPQNDQVNILSLWKASA